MEVKKEVNSLRSWLRALKARLGAKASKKLNWTIHNGQTASKNFQPATLAQLPI